MNKKMLALTALVLVFALGLSACGCAHETWTEADCLNPKTCADCGETEGEALGHSWKDADCVTPKTCTRCSATEGAAKGHDWAEATCAAPKTCRSCGLTEGAALEHTWTDATTEAPKTCTVCGATEGEKIDTDPRFTTANTIDLYGDWTCEISMPGETTGLAGFETPFELLVSLSLANDGEMNMSVALTNADAMSADLIKYMEDTLYTTLAAQDMSKEDADAYMKDTYDMTMTEYATTVVDAMDLAHLFDYMTVTGVYYAEDGEFWIGTDWDATLDSCEYTLEDDVLTLKIDLIGAYVEETVFTRVTE